MKNLAVLFLALAALTVVTPTSAARHPNIPTTPAQAYTQTRQYAYFSGLVPNTAYTVLYYASHYEGDPFPYVAATGVYSGSDGTATAVAPMDALAYGYRGAPDSPVYEVKACIAAASDPAGLAPLACTAETYVGHVPESMWDYTG